MLFGIIASDEKNGNGIFFQKGLSESEIVCQAWGLSEYEGFNHAPSKEKGRLASKSTEPTLGLAQPASVIEGGSGDGLRGQFSTGRISEVKIEDEDMIDVNYNE